MKILIDARLYGLEHAGPGRYTMNLIDELSKIDEKNQYVILLREAYFNTLKLPSNWDKVLAEFRHYTFQEQFQLPKIINQYNPDLVHFPFFNIPLFYFGPYIVTIHDLTMHKFRGGEATTRGFFRYMVWRLGYHLAFIKSVYFSKFIICPSNAVKKDIVGFYKMDPKKIKVIYEGVDDRIIKSKRYNGLLKKYDISTRYFIYSGSAYPHKNLVNAIKAILLLNKDLNQKVLFVITSARSIFTERLNLWINQLKAKKYVKLVGFIPDEDLGGLFEGSLAFIYPTLSEGFGLPGLEAMKSGTLAVVSDIEVLKEIYQDRAVYFSPDNPVSIYKAMERVVRMDTKVRKILIEKGKKYSQRYNWREMSKETLNVYESCNSI